MKIKKPLTLIAILTVIVFVSTLLLSAAQTPTATICFFAPDVHPELNQPFNIELSTANTYALMDVSLSLTWNSSNLQIQSATSGTYTQDTYTLQSVQVANQTLATLTFIANSTDPANLHLTATSNAALTYYVPYYAPFNSVTT